MNYRNIIAGKLAAYLNLDEDMINKLVEVPPKSDMGDFAFPCFQLSKTIKKSPNLIAIDIKENLGCIDGFEKIEALGPYINFFVLKVNLLKRLLIRFLRKKMIMDIVMMEQERM